MIKYSYNYIFNKSINIMSDYEEIKSGDIVYLKSGSLPMTVSHNDPFDKQYSQDPYNYWVCNWFERNKSKSEIFHISLLTKKTP